LEAEKYLNHVYKVPGLDNFGLMPTDKTLSNKSLQEPDAITSLKKRFHTRCTDVEIVNWFLDYKTFWNNKTDRGDIPNSPASVIREMLNEGKWKFATPSEVLSNAKPVADYNVPYTIPLCVNADDEETLNEAIRPYNSLNKIYKAENLVMSAGSKKDVEAWGRLQTLDYFRQMCMSRHENFYSATPSTSGCEVYKHLNKLVDCLEWSLQRKQIEKAARAF
jgi:hypothetical protein